MKRCVKAKMNTKAFEFGKVDDGPGPAVYIKKTTVGLTDRMPTFTNPPAYTIKQRLDAQPEFKSPGPVYNVDKVTNRGVVWAPKFSIGMNLAETAETDTPGPAVYKPETGRKSRLKILLPLKDVDPRADNPGPNVYKLPSTLSGVGFTLGKRLGYTVDIDSPGPAVHDAVPLNRYKEKSPHYTLAKKFDDPLAANEVSQPRPGPPAYSATPVKNYKYNATPKFSFGMRRPDKHPPLVVCGDEVVKVRKFA